MEENREDFISGIEFAIDSGLEISEEDFAKYKRLTASEEVRQDKNIKRPERRR